MPKSNDNKLCVYKGNEKFNDLRVALKKKYVNAKKFIEEQDTIIEFLENYVDKFTYINSEVRARKIEIVELESKVRREANIPAFKLPLQNPK